MGLSGGQAYNQALQTSMMNQQRVGNFGSNVASGAGAGLADYYFAQKMGA